MLGVARRILHNEEDARDAVQDAFLSAFRALGSFRAGSRLSTWLHRITVNASLMRIRRAASRPEEPIEDFLPSFLDDGHRASPGDAWGERADRLLERKEACEGVRRAIDRLPESYRLVLLARDIEGLSGSEVAEALGISTNAVKIRLHRARQALRELLDARVREVEP